MKTFIFIVASFLMIMGNAFAGAAPDIGSVFQDDPLNGPKKEYYPNGKVSKAYILDNGRINGSYKFYNEKGQLVSDQNYVDGVPQGYLKTYYENGQIRSETNMKDGLPQGPSKEYFENGILKKESNLTGSAFELSGKTILNYEDGKLWKEITVSQGKLVKAISYNKEGLVTSEESEGRYVSYWWDRDGKRHVSINGVEQE